jgi:hypothetical protein
MGCRARGCGRSWQEISQSRHAEKTRLFRSKHSSSARTAISLHLPSSPLNHNQNLKMYVQTLLNLSYCEQELISSQAFSAPRRFQVRSCGFEDRFDPDPPRSFRRQGCYRMQCCETRPVPSGPLLLADDASKVR